MTLLELVSCAEFELHASNRLLVPVHLLHALPICVVLVVRLKSGLLGTLCSKLVSRADVASDTAI